MDDIFSYPVTPVTLKVHSYIKGEDTQDTIIFYDADRLLEEEGVEVILFLDKDNTGWGGQSIYEVIDNQVKIKSSDIENIDESKISTTKLSDENDIVNPVNTTTINRMNKEDFIDVIKNWTEK